MSDDIENAANEFLRDTVAAHKRRVAIRQGNREPVTGGCSHRYWNHVRHWCEECGATLEELIETRNCLMNKRHSPGPWIIGGHPWNITDADDRLVASAHFLSYTPTALERDEVYANARLIAAAPDLLAALSSMAQWAITHSGDELSVMVAARSAIAKATGKQ